MKLSCSPLQHKKDPPLSHKVLVELDGEALYSFPAEFLDGHFVFCISNIIGGFAAGGIDAVFKFGAFLCYGRDFLLVKDRGVRRGIESGDGVIG